MRRYTCYIIGWIAVCMFSCSRRPVIEPTETPIVFGASIEVQTQIESKVSMPENNFRANDTIMIYAYRQASAYPFMSKAAFSYSPSISSFVANPSNKEAFWWRGVEHDFYAYYPPSLPIQESGMLAHPTISISMSDTIGLDYAADFLYAYQEDSYYEGDATVVDLAFSHPLARLNVSIKKNSDIDYSLSEVSVLLARKTGAFDMIERDWNYDTKQVFLYRKMDPPINIGETPILANADWLVLPGVRILSMTCCINGQKYQVKFNESIFTKSGKITTLSISVNNTILEYEMQDKAWDNAVYGGEISVE